MCEMERPRSMDVIHMSDNALYANPGQGQAFSLDRDRCISMMIGRDEGDCSWAASSRATRRYSRSATDRETHLGPVGFIPLIAGPFYYLYQSAIAALVIPMHADKCATTPRLILEDTGLKTPHFLREV
jgi:hypothetical protein